MKGIGKQYTLVMPVYDIDLYAPGDWELDQIYFNGYYIGIATGDDETWSINAFNINPAWINDGTPGSPGINVITIDIDVLTSPIFRTP